MSLGTLGSTLNDELNRLANGGTYRDSGAMVDEALAAKQWANRENITPYTTDTVGVLNEIAGLGTNRQNWLDFNGVCNYIAGTSGLPAAAALRQIYPTTDLLTGVASYYVDAATPRYNYPGFIRLEGIAGNALSIPNDSSLQITGDIEIIMRMSMDDWTPVGGAGGSEIAISKRTGGSQDSWSVGVINAGGLSQIQFAVRNSANTAYRVIFLTIPTAPVDGVTYWLRLTRSASTGVCSVFIQPDSTTIPTSWGTATSFTETIDTLFPGTANVQIGQRDSGVDPFKGKVYRAIIRNGIGGTTVLDVDLTTNVTSATYDQFTATTGQLCTIFGQNTLTNGGAAGSLLPTTVGSSLAADSNDPKFLDHTGTNYVYLPGVGANNLSIPDSAALDITGDIDVRAQIAPDSWTNTGYQYIISKLQSAVWSYAFFFDTGSGKLYFRTSPNGSTLIDALSTVATGFAAGTTKWVRATRDVDNGAGGNTTTFYTSDDGVSWTQLGATVVNAGTTSIFVGTQPVYIADPSSSPLVAKVYRAQILNGIDGTTVLDVDTSVITTGAATSFTAVTGQTVTINRSTSGRKTVAVTQPTWLFGTDDYMEVNNRYMAHSTSAENYVYLSGASGNYMSVSDNPPLDVTGDIDIRVRVALDDWTPSAINSLVSKWNSVGSEASYLLRVLTDGTLGLLYTTNGATTISRISTVATGITDGATKWVRATRNATTGTVQFFTSDDGITWIQLGADVAGTAGNIYSGSSTIEIGTLLLGTASPAKGKFFRAQILNGIDGTIVLDADASVITLPSQTTFVDRSSNAYTVTINKSGVGTFVSTGNYLYLPGIASNYASAPDSAALDITGDIDLRVKVALDDWTPSAQMALVSKDNVSASQRSYNLGINTSGQMALVWTTNGSTVIQKFSDVLGLADGATKWVRATIDVDNGASGNDVRFFTSDDGLTWTQVGTTQTTAGVTSIYSGTASLEVGSQAVGAAQARGKFFRAQVLNGIGGTVAFDANFENSITSLNQASFTESSTNGATVTINRSGSTFRSAGVIDAGYLYPGATNTFSNSTTDFLNFGATDSFTALAVVRQWNSATAGGRYINKGDTTGPRWAVFGTTGLQAQSFINDGTNSAISTISTSLTNGALSSFSMVIDRVAQTNTSYNSATAIAPVSTSSVGSISSVAAFRVGSSSNSSVFQDFEFVAGAVFRTALTATQIRQITNYFTNREAYL